MLDRFRHQHALARQIDAEISEGGGRDALRTLRRQHQMVVACGLHHGDVAQIELRDDHVVDRPTGQMRDLDLKVHRLA